MTNEEYLQAIDIRESRRSFSSKPLNSEAVAVIKELVDYVNEKSNLKFFFVEDGTKPFTAITGKFSYIAVCGADTQKAREDCGYWGETIVLQCAYHGIASCWTCGSYNENKVYEQIELGNKERLYAVIVLGYAKKNKTVKEKLVYNTLHRKNKPYQKMIEVCDEKLPDYFVSGFKAVEKAPSSVNRRPVIFKYENGILSARVEDPYSDKSLDFGIAKLHFQLGCAASGVKGSWNLINQFLTDEPKVIKFPEESEKREED